MILPGKLAKRLEDRKLKNVFRYLGLPPSGLCDFSSNDYLGFATSQEISTAAEGLMKEKGGFPKNGATGSRLLTGNHFLYASAEDFIAEFHNAESALIFNSGYDANIGLFSAVPQRGDIIIYDELIHASIRDGISLSNARAFKFAHNNPEDLISVIERNRKDKSAEIYIVTESVFSMDGDLAPLKELAINAEKSNYHLIVDEAHATGVFGRGLVQELGLEAVVFARINTFGKALGCHGAAILGSKDLINYLVNFARSFIYTTALPPHAIATALSAYQFLAAGKGATEQLRGNIEYFKAEIVKNNLQSYFIESKSAIQSCIFPGNAVVKELSGKLKAEGNDVKSILSPTVPEGKERLRFCIHSFNSEAEIQEVLRLLATFIK